MPGCVKSWGEACRFISLAIPADTGLPAYSLEPQRFSILFDMPTQVITVRRPRRRWFAVPRAFPDWLRSVWTALFRTAASKLELAVLSPVDSDVTNVSLFPQLTWDAKGAHLCVGCDLCIRVCPSRCLTLETEGKGRGLRVTRFELVHGACIGGGLCDEACPEDAIEMAARSRVEPAPLSGRPGVADLLTKRS
jgi:ferredoxin